MPFRFLFEGGVAIDCLQATAHFFSSFVAPECQRRLYGSQKNILINQRLNAWLITCQTPDLAVQHHLPPARPTRMMPDGEQRPQIFTPSHNCDVASWRDIRSAPRYPALLVVWPWFSPVPRGTERQI